MFFCFFFTKSLNYLLHWKKTFLTFTVVQISVHLALKTVDCFAFNAVLGNISAEKGFVSKVNVTIRWLSLSLKDLSNL